MLKGLGVMSSSWQTAPWHYLERRRRAETIERMREAGAIDSQHLSQSDQLADDAIFRFFRSIRKSEKSEK